MTIIDMLEQSVILTVLGMAVVFAFLWLMIVCVNLTGKFIQRMGWDKDIRDPKEEAPKAAAQNAAVTAAISAAIVQYREQERHE
ncbi:MAG: OadG family protein [Treponema sp.]|jgi:oxaloacetate decarboxylase gamma subunit|nr:OadG family protein [Treponema sp.]